MKTTVSSAIGLLVVLVLLAWAGPATAAGGPTVSVTVNRSEVRSGAKVVVTATAPVRCQWLVQWNGENRVTNGSRFRGVFTVPEVTVRTRLPVLATCFYASGTGSAIAEPGGSVQVIGVRVPERTLSSTVITVLPPKGAVAPPAPPQQPSSTGGLPNTGGPSWGLLLAGLVTLGVGVGAVRRSRNGSVRTQD